MAFILAMNDLRSLTEPKPISDAELSLLSESVRVEILRARELVARSREQRLYLFDGAEAVQQKSDG